MPDQEEADRNPVPQTSVEPVGSSAEEAEESSGDTGPPEVEVGNAPAPVEAASPAGSSVEALSREPLSSAPVAQPREMYRTVGLAIVAAGLGLAVAALASPQAAFLQRLGDPLVPAGTLIVGGLVLFGVGVLRRALAPVRGEVEYIANQTPLMDQIAEQGRQLQSEFGAVESALGAARQDMRTLSGIVEQLMQLAANPEFETSLFRMAASLDQLGARLDLSIKGQLDAMQERLQGFQENSRRSSEELTLELKILDEHLQAQDSGRREGELETRAHIDESAAKIQARIDREAEAFERVTGEIVQLEDCVTRCVEQQLADLREHVENTVGAASHHSGERMDQCTQAVAGIGGELGRLEHALAENVEHRLGDLREHVTSVVQASSDRSSGRLDQGVQAIAGIREELDRVHGALTESVSGIAGESTRTAGEVASGLAELNREMRQAVEGQGSSSASRFAGLESALSQQAERLGEWEAALEEKASARGAEWSERLDDHRTQLEQTIGTRCDALASDLTAIAELVCEFGSSVREASEPEAPAAEVPVAEAPAAELSPPEPLDETPEQPPGPRPFGHGVQAAAESSSPLAESDWESVQAPLPAKNEAPSPAARPHDYPVERLGHEFDDGWIDG
jgi:hypothetical protein